MKYRTRTYYTDAQKAVMWERWKQGWTLHQIAQLFNRSHTSVQGILARTGGIRPARRTRTAMALSLLDRIDWPSAIAREISSRSGLAHFVRSAANSLRTKPWRRS